MKKGKNYHGQKEWVLRFPKFNKNQVSIYQSLLRVSQWLDKEQKWVIEQTKKIKQWGQVQPLLFFYFDDSLLIFTFFYELWVMAEETA